MVSPDSQMNIVVLCEICDRTFKSKEELKAHKLTHEEMPVLEKSSPPGDARFYCKPCDKQYMGYSGISDHNRKKHPERQRGGKKRFPAQCSYCDKMFTTAGAYANHKMMHERNNDVMSQSSSSRSTPNTESNDDESYHTCKKCFKVFSTRSNLKSHMKSHGINLTSPSTAKTGKKPAKKVWCDTCHCAFENAAHLQKHREEEHDNPMPNLRENFDDKGPFVFTCDVCVQTFTSKSGLKKHKAKHAKEAPILMKNRNTVRCKYCKVSFETSQQLAFHMKEEHVEPTNGKKEAEPIREFYCKRCKKHFKTYNALCAHMGWHNREGKVKENLDKMNSNGVAAGVSATKPKVKEEPKDAFVCGKCNAGFSNDTALQIHILEKHRNVNAIVLAARCSACNIDFGTQEEYEQHRLLHNKNKQNAQQQQQASKQQSGKQQSQQGKNFLCTHCNTVCRNFDALQLHIREMHSKNEQPKQEFKCGQCSRVFDRENSLQIHLKVHAKYVKTAPAQTAKTPMFNCSICNQSFALPKDLRTHTIQAHPF